MQRRLTVVSEREETGGDLDFRVIGTALRRRYLAVLVPTLLALALVTIFVNVVTPRYTAESQVLLENQETFFTRPDRAASFNEQVALVDPEAVGSQIQLMTSRDLARRAIKELGLIGNPEFDPTARGMSIVSRAFVLLGLARDPTQEVAENRVLQAFQDKLTVFSPTKTRVITIQFQSKDPLFAARVANKIAELYLAEQSAAKRVGAKEAADALSGQIADLRVKLAKADAEREQYRADTGLLAGNNNLTISGQQLADINGDLSKARAAQADAQAKASMIRELVRAGKTADVLDVVNSDLVRRVAEQRVTARSQLALEAQTLLPGHPRMKALTAQIAELDVALKAAAKQSIATLENDAKIAGQRVANLETVLSQQKKVAGTANGDEVRLRSLDRVAQAYKDQLENSTTKYQEALARENSTATPSDARIIARAVPPQEPTFPKKLPFIAFGVIATLVLTIGFIVASELFGGSAARDGSPSTPATRRIDASEAAEPDQALGHGLADMAATPRRATASAPPVEAAKIEPAEIEPAAPVRESAPAAKPRHLPPLWDWRRLVRGLRDFGRSAEDSRPAEAHGDPSSSSERAMIDGGIVLDDANDHDIGHDAEVGHGAEDSHDAEDSRRMPMPSMGRVERVETTALAGRIVAAHVPGRGLHIVGASLGIDADAVDPLLDLGRTLSDRGRAIVVDLDAGPARLAKLASPDGEGTVMIAALTGLSDLLAGKASFAEVIHRDHASRLHFIPTGSLEADFRDFDLILDALSETYDFVVLLAPEFPRSEIAKVMAPYADFLVLTATTLPDVQMLDFLEAELVEAGAREVLVLGRTAESANARAPHVA